MFSEAGSLKLPAFCLGPLERPSNCRVEASSDQPFGSVGKGLGDGVQQPTGGLTQSSACNAPIPTPESLGELIMDLPRACHDLRR